MFEKLIETAYDHRNNWNEDVSKFPTPIQEAVKSVEKLAAGVKDITVEAVNVEILGSEIHQGIRIILASKKGFPVLPVPLNRYVDLPTVFAPYSHQVFSRIHEVSRHNQQFSSPHPEIRALLLGTPTLGTFDPYFSGYETGYTNQWGVEQVTARPFMRILKGIDWILPEDTHRVVVDVRLKDVREALTFSLQQGINWFRCEESGLKVPLTTNQRYHFWQMNNRFAEAPNIFTAA